jgi:hypothetical protein
MRPKSGGVTTTSIRWPRLALGSTRIASPIATWVLGSSTSATTSFFA